ncbi:MAG TPA: class I SAM-dependent methyltransferase [Steroidobacteraceae bacterium]|jgi:SAM-dependent methyltransferase
MNRSHTIDDKAEIQKQWDRDPCGAVTADNAEAESAAWYESVRRHRYEVYAPWMPGAMRFEDWKERDVLEIGVGLGSDHLSLALAGSRMHALDLSAEHLRHTRKHLAAHALQTEGVLGDAEANPFPDASFDLVYSFGVLHHTPDTARAVREVLRVLRPGGTALIGLYHRDSWFFWLWTVLFRGVLRCGIPKKGWRRLLSEIEYRSADNPAVPLVKVYSRPGAAALFTGFEDVRTSVHHVEAGHFPPPFSWLLRPFSRPTLERWLGFGGWYVIVRARKAAG